MFFKKILFFIIALIEFAPCAQLKVISLGCRCWTAGALRKYGLHQETYPFDWIVSPSEAIIKAIEDDFTYFLVDEFLKPSDDNCAVVDYYGFEFRHEFTAPGLSTINEQWKKMVEPIRIKLRTRIQRLINTLNAGSPVMFIRSNDTTQEEFIRMHTVLIQKYPHTPITLVALGTTEDFATDWSIPSIIPLRIDGEIFWDNPQWENIFRKLHLI